MGLLRPLKWSLKASLRECIRMPRFFKFEGHKWLMKKCHPGAMAQPCLGSVNMTWGFVRLVEEVPSYLP